MSGEPARFGYVLLFLTVTALITLFAVILGSIAFRKSHYLFDWVKQFRGGNPSDSQEHDGVVRANLLALSAFLLWAALLIGVMGVRYVLR